MRPRAAAMCALIGMVDRFFEYRRAVGAPPVGALAHFRVAPLRENRRARDGLITSFALIMPAVPGDTLHINGADILLVAMTTKHRLGRDVFLLSFRLGDAHRDLESERYY